MSSSIKTRYFYDKNIWVVSLYIAMSVLLLKAFFVLLKNSVWFIYKNCLHLNETFFDKNIWVVPLCIAMSVLLMKVAGG